MISATVAPPGITPMGASSPMSFDLLSVPDDHEVEFVLVIAPYFDGAFAKALVQRLRPQRIYFLVDDGARGEDLKDLRKAVPKKIDLRIALAGTSGLVHLKCIYIKSSRADGTKKLRRRRILFGSANATMAAFGGRNAELIAHLNLSRTADAGFLRYLKRVEDGIRKGGGVIECGSFGPFSRTPTLCLPSFRISEPGPPPGFDAWLQRGRLVARYRDAQGFLTVSLRLKATLPPDSLSTAFSARRLIELGERRIVRYPYLGEVEPPEEDEAVAHQWGARFGVWSRLGTWMSESCHEANRRQFTSKASARRRAKLLELLKRGEDAAWQAERKADFLSALEGVWDDLGARSLADPRDYLEARRGVLNRAFYQERFDAKLASDLSMARDEDFVERYVSGYDFPQVPKFRQDQESWEAFALSVCTSISIEAPKNRTVSRITKAVRSAATLCEVDLEGLKDSEVLTWVRKSWNQPIAVDGTKTTVGEHVAGYWGGGAEEG